MEIDRVTITTFAGYYFSQILCLRSIQKYAPGFPIDIIIDDFDINHWPSYPQDCEKYVQDNFPDLDITFHQFSDFAGMDRVKTGGWFRQQLIKLYLDSFVAGNRWLLVDADVVFLEPPNLDVVSAVVRNVDPIGTGNRLYIKQMLACDQPWLETQHEYWCVSGVPFRLLQRDLLEQLRKRISTVNHSDVFELHLNMFEDQSLVAFDSEGKKMVMSEFQLIEVFRNKYYHTPLIVKKHSAIQHTHSSIKDWNRDRHYFTNQDIKVTDQTWQRLLTFGMNRA